MPARRSAKRPAAGRSAKRPAAKKAGKRTARKAPAKRSARKAPTKRATAKGPGMANAPGGPRRPGTQRADKGEGKAAHANAIGKLRAEHRAMAERIDAIVAREFPEAKRAVKWGSPMWGAEGRGWFMAFGSFKEYAKVNFFSGTELDPVPPEGEGKGMRSVNIPRLKELDEARMASWIRQASRIKGWGTA